MNEPSGKTSNGLWIGLGLIGVTAFIIAFFVLKPSGDDGPEGHDRQGASDPGVVETAGKVLSAGWQIQKTAVQVPEDADGFVTIKTQQVLRSPILGAAKLTPEKVWDRLRLDPQVKAFIESSGIDMERGKRLSLIVRGLATRPRSPHVVALWEGAFDPKRVAQALKESLKATDLQVGEVTALGNEALGYAADEVVMLGNRPLFDDLLQSKGDFAAQPGVQKVLSSLGKQGAITAVFRILDATKVKVPMIPVEKITWLGAALDVMGAPKLRIVALTGSNEHAEQLAAGVESALGLASLGLSTKPELEPLIELMNLIKVEVKNDTVTVSVEVPLSQLLDLRQSASRLVR